ncbi:MAG TPA: SAM-dependent chlorinase/fluorinase [Candidatus Thermoplasmatota archaeon]
MAPSTITLTTDFGWTELPAAIRGAIREVAPPGTEVVDITHSVPRHDVIQGAYAMLTTCPIFRGAVHIGVVDPGVGTKRRAVAIETPAGFLVGPDNGLLFPLAHRLHMERAVTLTAGTYWRAPVSATFHGRDIFAPVAGHLAAGVRLDQLGTPIDDLVQLPAFEVHDHPREVRGSVVRIDRFGNIVTGIPSGYLVDQIEEQEPVEFRIGGRRVMAQPVSAYGHIEKRGFGVIVNSAGFIEIAVSGASAAQRTEALPGDTVVAYK